MFFSSSPIPAYLLFVNLYLFFIMYLDWKQAKKDGWRIPEWQMLTAGLLGGGVAGLLAMSMFQHKRERKRFVIIFQLGTIIGLILLGTYLGWIK